MFGKDKIYCGKQTRQNYSSIIDRFIRCIYFEAPIDLLFIKSIHSSRFARQKSTFKPWDFLFRLKHSSPTIEYSSLWEKLFRNKFPIWKIPISSAGFIFYPLSFEKKKCLSFTKVAFFSASCITWTSPNLLHPLI